MLLRRIVPYLVVLLAFLLPTHFSAAQDSLTLSVTPPFFQLTVAPGETWSSSVKVVNVNNYDLTTFASPVNFESDGESGKGKFTPLLNDTPEYREATLAGWVDITSNPINVAPGQSAKVPFTINVPENAPPGGHYAAILVGNQPVLDEDEGPAIAVSTLISSLIFVRVTGDVIEEGDIREFVADTRLSQEPEIPLTLRFENEGSVHLLPQGDITIFNMWGKERGKILINQGTEFGNVLPGATRKYNFVWKGDPDEFEIGRYKAVATLAFGSDSKQNVVRETSFWVIPLVPVAATLVSVIAIILLFVWFVRRYIRNALGEHAISSRHESRTRRMPAKTLAKPLVDGVMDLRNVSFDQESKPQSLTFASFIRRYKVFFYFVIFVIVAAILIYSYFGDVLVSDHNSQIEEIVPVDS